MMIDKSKTYKTRDGREVRIYATDGGGDFSVHGAVYNSDGWLSRSWRKAGGAWTIGFDHASDLIEIRPRIKRTVWLNVYRSHTTVRDSKQEANSNCHSDRLACVKVEIDCEEGTGI